MKAVFSWDSGPVIEPTELGVLKFNDGGPREEIIGRYGDSKAGGGMTIFIDTDALKELQNSRGRANDYMLFLVAVTILHEAVHYVMT